MRDFEEIYAFVGLCASTLMSPHRLASMKSRKKIRFVLRIYLILTAEFVTAVDESMYLHVFVHIYTAGVRKMEPTPHSDRQTRVTHVLNR